MPDAIFSHPRLAPIYDTFDDDRDDLDAYLRIAEDLGAHSVLDLGCGTGSLSVLLAQRSHAVFGVDPALASLDVAKSKPDAELVTWTHGDARTLPQVGADLALMTGNVAQVFLTDHDWYTTLARLRDALRAGGHLVFEARRPERRVWEEWVVDTGPEVRHVEGEGMIEQRREVTAVVLPYVSFRHTYTFASDGQDVTSNSTLRFRSRAEIEESLLVSGFRTLEVREAPDRPGREFVFIAQRLL